MTEERFEELAQTIELIGRLVDALAGVSWPLAAVLIAPFVALPLLFHGFKLVYVKRQGDYRAARKVVNTVEHDPEENWALVYSFVGALRRNIAGFNIRRPGHYFATIVMAGAMLSLIAGTVAFGPTFELGFVSFGVFLIGVLILASQNPEEPR